MSKLAKQTEVFRQIVGHDYVILSAFAKEKYETELRGAYHSHCKCVLLPANTDEVSKIVSYCQQEKIAMVAQGGNTGTVGGAVATEHQVIINLARLNRMRDYNPVDNTMTVESGCILQQVQQWAQEKSRFFPLSLAAQGSCQIGGNLATNAGGINVLKFGNMRDLVLGIEAVMPDGSILNALSELRKDNSGYDLKNLLIGSEGTLGIITAATLKLFYPMQHTITAWLGFDDISNLVALKQELEIASQQNLISFELMSNVAIDLVHSHFPTQQCPLKNPCQWHVLIVVASLTQENPFEMHVLECLERFMQNNSIKDIAISQNERQHNDFIALREHIPEAQKKQGKSIKNDISVPIKSIVDFIAQGESIIKKIHPNLRPCVFGHVGDGNLHYNICVSMQDEADFQQLQSAVHDEINQLVANFLGSFSAEHGVGLLKTQYMQAYKDPVALMIMHKIKNALDPNNLCNPHKLIPPIDVPEYN